MLAKITAMTPLLRAAPSRIRCETDLNGVQLRLRRPFRLLPALITVCMLAFSGGLASVAFSSTVEAAVLGGGLIAVLAALWLWFSRKRAMHVALDPDILDVRLSGFGAHYRIPLFDIQRVSVLPDGPGGLRIELPDDVIEVGQGFVRDELGWLCRVVREAAEAARKRPARREGMPDEVPAQLRALQKSPAD